MTDILDELAWRGLLAHHTDLDELRRAFAAGPVTFYGGFDPTAPGLHIGNLVLLLTMRRVQNAGHRPIGLVGGATGLIGDPSGKSAERVLNPRETVAAWVQRIRGEVERFLDFAPGPTGALVVSNLDWTADLTALDFLRDIGKHFPVNRMLARESVKARLEAGGISYTEFSYQILQANDFLELHRRHGCALQIGGSDQWGNLVAGVDLIKRVEGASAHALATPLITEPDGTKYGKTESDAVWLSADLMSPYRFYQFWINRSDAEVAGLLRVFTFRSAEEIEELERQTRDSPAARPLRLTSKPNTTRSIKSSSCPCAVTTPAACSPPNWRCQFCSRRCKDLYLTRRKTRPRLQRHALNHNFVRRPWRSRDGRRSHDDFGILDTIDHAAKDRVLLVECRLFLQRDEPLTIRAVYVLGAGGSQGAAFVRNVAELCQHVRIRRVPHAIHVYVISLCVRIAALNNPQLRVDAMNCGAVIKLFAD